MILEFNNSIYISRIVLRNRHTTVLVNSYLKLWLTLLVNLNEL
jgi:hypothetical protein